LIYPIRHKFLAERLRVFYSMNSEAGTTPAWFVWILAVLLLISAGITYRVLASQLKLVVSTPIRLPVPLSYFPEQVGDWVGQDVEIPPNIKRVAGNDAFLSRLYTNKPSDQLVNVYVAYTSRPRTMLGHRPRVCYVAGGWVHDSTQQAKVVSSGGREFPCLVHRFHRPAPESEETVVLNFYIVNGQLTSDEDVFSGVGWRTPNINGNPARYATQVQISSALESSVRAAAKVMTELILDFFPDQDGKVKAIEYIEPVDNVLEVDQD
jgi:EpsI family protein